MAYTFQEVLTWTFTQQDLKSAVENYTYLRCTWLEAPDQASNTDFIQAVDILKQAASIGNPIVCGGLFAKAGSHFRNARKTQRDEPKLMSYIGEMFCNHWMDKDHLNITLQQEISTMKYNGSFWHRYGNDITDLGAAALTAIGALFGAPPGPTAGVCGKGAKSIEESNSEEADAKVRNFNNMRNIVLSLRF